MGEGSFGLGGDYMLSSGISMLLWFMEKNIENRRKYFSVYAFLPFYQWIFELDETFGLELFIKMFRQVGIDVFHGSRVRMMANAVRLHFLWFL
jgi:hypothetical protein